MTGINFADLLSEAGDGGGNLPDGGPYDAQVEQCEAKVASTGKPMIVARFRIITGPHANSVVVNNFVISQGNPNALRFFFQHMAVFGMSREYFNTPGLQLEQVAANMVGRQARLTLATKDGRQNVSKVENIPGGMVAPTAAAPPATPLLAQTPAYQPSPIQTQPPAVTPPLQYTQVASAPVQQAAPVPEVTLPSQAVTQEPAPAVQPIVATQPVAASTAPPEIPF